MSELRIDVDPGYRVYFTQRGRAVIDAAFVAKALGEIARAKGMSQVARDAGLSRESLYKALSGERSPEHAESGTRGNSPNPTSPPSFAKRSLRSRLRMALPSTAASEHSVQQHEPQREREPT